MTTQFWKTGLGVLGDMAWGSHWPGRRKAVAAGVRASALLRDASPSPREIVRVARAKRGDIIVMGTHGSGGLAKMFLGSVAERVVRTASCPVLTVRGT